MSFEGGFAPRSMNDIPGFEKQTVQCRYAFDEYLHKIKKSALVFNTPAVAGCHGWKLGEFLALGKAIISTPLSRQLPIELRHGEHLHIVDGSQEAVQQAVELLCRDHDYRCHLEQNARNYFNKYLHPRCVIERLIEEDIAG